MACRRPAYGHGLETIKMISAPAAYLSVFLRTLDALNTFLFLLAKTLVHKSRMACILDLLEYACVKLDRQQPRV